jgi:membrane protease YdiL (CAAX protease family)
VTAFTGEINSMMDFPAGLSGVEAWMTEKEQEADLMIKSLIAAGSFGIMLLNLFTLALMPAIAEEFLFRGVFQRIFTRLFRSGHLAIWLTAFIFSAIHLQFFGFLPRFVLGLVFGYLFFWSGTLWLPVTAHFVNNAFPVIFSYLQGSESLTIPVGIPLWKQALALPVPIVIGIVILLYFRRITADRANVSQI